MRRSEAITTLKKYGITPSPDNSDSAIIGEAKALKNLFNASPNKQFRNRVKREVVDHLRWDAEATKAEAENENKLLQIARERGL